MDLQDLFGVSTPATAVSLLGADPAEELKKTAGINGLLSGVVGYLAQPKNQRYGSALPYIANAWMQGQKGVQNTYDTAVQDYLTKQKLDQAKQQKEYINTWINNNPEMADMARAYPDLVPKLIEESVKKKNDYTPDYKNYLADMAQRKDPEKISFGEWLNQDANRKQPKTNVTVVNDMNKESYKGFYDKVQGIQKTGLDAIKTLPNLQAMDSLLNQNVPTGISAPYVKTVSKIGQMFNPDFNVKDLSNQEAFTALSNQAILPQVKQLGVNPTDSDLRFIVAASPNLANSATGNKIMVKALLLKNQREQALTSWANKWRIAHIADIKKDPMLADTYLDRDLQQYMSTDPLFTTAAQQLQDEVNAILSNQTSGGSKVNPDVTNALSVNGFIRKPVQQIANPQ